MPSEEMIIGLDGIRFELVQPPLNYHREITSL